MAKKLKEVDDIIAGLSPERKAKIKARSDELILQERTLQELRKVRDITQAEVAALLNLGQDNISRLENRTDIKLSSLRNYIEALGGNLKLIAEFPDTEAIEISGLDKDVH